MNAPPAIAAADQEQRIWRRKLASETKALRDARRDASPLVARFSTLEGLDPAPVIARALKLSRIIGSAAEHDQLPRSVA